MLRRIFAPLLLLPLAMFGCSDESTTPPVSKDIVFKSVGSTSAPSGKGSFRFGASSAATQIEDQNPNVDWYVWTAPAPDGLGKGTFIADAAKGYTKALDDVNLAADMHLDSYRFSIEWARIEPQRDQIDEAAIQHYRDVLEALKAKGIRPMVTVHHFSNPVWIADPRDLPCANGPTDQNLCGLGHPAGGPLVVAEMADHARLLAERFGDLVDDWCTVNEPINYVLAAYGNGQFPPGKNGILDPVNKVGPVVRDLISAHAAMYKAIKEADTVDADGDGVPASVGLTKEAAEWVAAAGNAPSEAPADVAAREKVLWIYQYLFVDAIREGSFDADLDGTLDEPHPEWKGTLDWIGVQYYFRAGVTGSPGLLLGFTPCFGTFDFGACVPPLDESYIVPDMDYEHDPAGLTWVLTDYAKRWPDLPMTVTEAGIATKVGKRRAEIIVRELEAINEAIKQGADVRGYYHWSLTDNFEWALGFIPRFGLYTVDYTTYERTATEGATVLGEIAKARTITEAQLSQYGGTGPLSAEE